MVAIKQTLSALPLLLAVASKVAGQQFYDDDLAVRGDFADEEALLEARFDDEDDFLLETRDDDDFLLEARDDDDFLLEARDDEDFLEARDDEMMLEERGGMFSKPSKPTKASIGKPTNVKGTNPVAIPDSHLKSSKRPVSSSSGYIPIGLDPKLKKGKRSMYRRGGMLSKPSKPKIGKPTNPRGTNPVVIPDSHLKSSKRPVSSSSGYIPIALDPKLKKGKRSVYGNMYARGGMFSKPSKPSKASIGRPTNVKGTNPVVIPDSHLKSSKRPASSSSGYIPIALDPKLRKGKRSMYARGGMFSKPSKPTKASIGKPTNVKGTNPVVIPDSHLKSSKRPASSSSGYIPIALDPKLRKGKRSMYARGGMFSKPSKPTKASIGKPTNVKGTNPVAIPDSHLKSSKRPASSSSGYIPIALDPKLRKGKRSSYW